MKQTHIENLLNKETLLPADLGELLRTRGEDRLLLFAKGAEVKKQYVGNVVYFRGLIEYGNLCRKNCYYCGIRKDNTCTGRYTMTDEEVIDAARFAFREGYASLVLQSGELMSKSHRQQITRLLQMINHATEGKMGITLSLGEQDMETLAEWRNAGARRYLLRIETSNPHLYSRLHPQDAQHDFKQRIETLKMLKNLDYQVGTGVMIGLPFQTIEDLANDLCFFRDYDIDMIGMGPYIEHEHTPLYAYRQSLLPQAERFDLGLKMIALARIMMKDINIAATTAMQAIDKMGREKALKVGANVMMPNLTPQKYRENYLLYQDKPCTDEEAEQCKKCLEIRVKLAGDQIGYKEWGDSKHYANRIKRKTD
ncbi:MAG: [FeFe] hydrogenase H-cluster radical SAM maturase HydE [Bacteroidales bacterium]|jgi:biotin synthase|nr:[FeFe] hydrogenase H-cluster radical SAM maturase HydE [Bacteroidales bacterium]